MVPFLVGFSIGVLTYIYGIDRKWGFLKTVLVSWIITTIMYVGIFLLSALADQKAPASETAMGALRQSVVHLNVGSGSVVEGKSGKLYVLTNYHVCIEARVFDQIHASYDGGISLNGDIVAMNAIDDLCLVKISDKVPALKVAKKFNRREPIYTRGYPSHIVSESAGYVTGDLQFEYTYDIEQVGECPKGLYKRYGVHNQLTGCTVINANTLTNLYSYPGSSGSPVVNKEGELVGVIESWSTENRRASAGMVKFEAVKALLEKF